METGQVSLRLFLQRLRGWRLARGWTQGEAARLAGVSRATYENLEAGHANLSLHSLLRLLAMLGCEARFADLLPEAPAPAPKRRPGTRSSRREVSIAPTFAAVPAPSLIEERCLLD